MLHEAIYLSDKGSIHGQGLFTAIRLAPREVIWQRDPAMKTYKVAEVLGWSQKARDDFFWYAFQCDADTFIFLEGIDRYMNHSCSANTWWLDDNTLIAARPIQAGEEVTYDYATTEISVPYQMMCHCGTVNCRGIVTERDCLDPAWQLRYGDHLPSFVLDTIEMHRGSSGVR
ncbi:MAG: SET domain-containing protein [Chloroflexi bacterium]|nr:SET domain-containing protein [Chloroflexota bacterium]